MHDFLKNQFLVAMPTLSDPNFHQTVTYICEHNSEGALGIVINRPMDVRLGDILEQLQLEAADDVTARLPVFSGGPMQQERGFVIHQPPGNWESTLQITHEVGLTTSRDVLAAIARGAGPSKSFVALGYAGWSAGQLEDEMANNAWLNTPADSRIIFDTPTEKRWEGAARLLGVDLAMLTGDAGHA